MSIELFVGLTNGTVKRQVSAIQNGQEIHRDVFDTDSAYLRRIFAVAVDERLHRGGQVPSDDDLRNYNAVTGGPGAAALDVDTFADRIRAEADRVDAEQDKIETFAQTLPVFQRITCPELDAAEYAVEYLCRWILTAGQPCIFAGGKKCLKTSLLVALAIALATARPFLGFFDVPRAARVLMMSGESGLATIQETARRIAHSMDLQLAEIGNLIFSPSLPRFGDALHRQALEKMLTDDEIEVLILDPAYLCLPTQGGESSLFAMGELMAGIIEACQRCGVTLILAHHTKKGVVDPYAPPELEHIAFAGFAEIARQWILVGRQERYEPGSGRHRLWLNCGGSAGHSSCHAVTVEEGAFDGVTPRYWSVEILKAEEARRSVDARLEKVKQAKASEQILRDKKAILDSAAKFPNGETMTVIRDTAGVRTQRFEMAFAALMHDGDLEPVQVKKGNGASYPGYKLKVEK